MLAVELPKEIDARLDRLVRRTGRSKAEYVKEALLECLDDWEDLALTEEELEAVTEGEEDIRHGRTQSLEDLRNNLPVSPEALDVLRSMEEASEYVFPNPDGGMKTKSSVIDTWKKMKKHAELPPDFRFHGLRHNFASWLVSNGVDLGTRQELMTHKHASTTERYAHLMPGAVKDAAAKAGSLFAAAAKKDTPKTLVKMKK